MSVVEETAGHGAEHSGERVPYLMSYTASEFTHSRELVCPFHLTSVQLVDLQSGSLEVACHLVERAH